MGKFILDRIRDGVRACLALGSTAYNDLSIPPDKASVIAELLSILPGASLDRDALLEQLDTPMHVRWSFHSRDLAPFSNYVKFEENLHNAWNSADEKERIHLFPTYFWWTLTTILPLRPTEFLLTPRDCLQERSGVYHLTVRRTRLKKGLRRVWYQIDRDYERFTYEIPNSMAKSLLWYLDTTSHMSS